LYDKQILQTLKSWIRSYGDNSKLIASLYERNTHKMALNVNIVCEEECFRGGEQYGMVL